MYSKVEIICSHCHNKTGLFNEDFTHFVIMSDILCPRCGHVLIKHNPVLC
jgi:DNA-directed RNA polymerase subunit RPC12/RpoP